MGISVEGSVGANPEPPKQSALFSAAKELLVELIWKGR